MGIAVCLLRRAVRKLYPGFAYRSPPQSGFSGERLYAWLDTVWHRRHIDGNIVEVGCNACGTSLLTFQLLKRAGCFRRYICIDTFAGFVGDQFDHDVQHGLDRKFRWAFAFNTVDFIRKWLPKYGASEIELVQGDIVNMPDDLLPSTIVACLMDVDLEIPIYAGLKRIYPRLVRGGAILVDDCDETSQWGAKRGYLRFLKETGLPQKLFLGMGLIEKP